MRENSVSNADVRNGEVADFNQRVISEFRANGGEVGGVFSGTDLLLLTTVGAVSAEEHTVPLGYVSDNQGVLVVASSGGSDHYPDWYRNLLTHPMVTVETGTEEYAAVAVPTVGEERDRLFRSVVQHYPGYAEYQSRTSRTIPVVRLERSFGDDTSSSATVADKLVEVHTWLRGQLDRSVWRPKPTSRDARNRERRSPLLLPGWKYRSGSTVWRSARPSTSTTRARIRA